VQRTVDAGGPDARAHIERLFLLVEKIGAGLVYDREALWYAIWMHDWGAYPEMAVSGVGHHERSREIAAEVLDDSLLTAAALEKCLYAIEVHDYRDTRETKTREAALLREADFLDFLGVTGLLRALASSGSKDMSRGFEIAIRRRDAVIDRFTLPIAQDIARERVEYMNTVLDRWQKESQALI